MPQINLIHEQRASMRRREAQARSGLLVFVSSLGLTAVASGVLLLQSQMLRDRQDRLEAELKKLEPIAKQIDENNNENARLTPRLKTLSDARMDTDRWKRILDHLAVNTPKETWMLTLRSQADDPQQPVKVIFNGMSTAQAPIGDLLLRTQNSADLENVNLSYTEERQNNSKKAIQFEFVASLVGNPDEQPAKEAAK